MMTSHKKCPPLGHITHFCGEVRGVLLVLLYAFIAFLQPLIIKNFVKTFLSKVQITIRHPAPEVTRAGRMKNMKKYLMAGCITPTPLPL